MKRKVLCTSTGCLDYAPERYLKEHDIGIIRIRVLFKGKEMLEGLDLDPVKFYEELETLEDVKNNLPKTAMPSRIEIQEHFDKAIAEGYDEILVVSISSGLGGTPNLIRLTAEDYKDKIKITVIDTMITCFAEGYIAVLVSEMAKKGVPTETIVKEVEWIKRRQELIGVDGKLDYLIYNGRLTGGKAFFGKMLSVCPVVAFNREGKIAPLCSVRTQKKALAKMCEIMKEKIGDRKPEDYMLSHVYTGPSLIEKLKEIEPEYGVKCNHEAVIMSPVSGCHNGPWLAGYIYIPKRREDEPIDE